METIAADAPPGGAQPDDTIALVRSAIDESLRVAGAALELLRAELSLARGSALALFWLCAAMVFFGVGAWLATSAAIAAGVYQLTGNLFYGIGSVALVNVVAIVVVLRAMRTCWRNLALPRTRRVIADFRGSTT
jgi:hypothetical protein